MKIARLINKISLTEIKMTRLMNEISLTEMINEINMIEIKLIDDLIQLYSKLKECVKRKHLSLSTKVSSHIELRTLTDR
jgi:hypothetical protein